MINGFEKETQELSNYEHTLVPILVKGLLSKKGKSQSITNKQICEILKPHYRKINQVRVRKIIHYIRCNRLVTNLIATSKGYYRAENKKELDDYRKSLVQRINSIAELNNSFD